MYPGTWGPEQGGGFAPGSRTRPPSAPRLPVPDCATLYLTDIRTLDAADEAWREFFPGPVRPARVEIESPLLIAEALSEVSVIAVRTPAAQHEPQGWKAPADPINHAILAAGTLFFSTLRPVNPATGELVGGTSLAAQNAQVVRDQEALLRAVVAYNGNTVSPLSRNFWPNSNPFARHRLDSVGMGGRSPQLPFAPEWNAPIRP
jgi:enamine deaminase RidA (YjgF/YER057c/UK114 family)